MWCANAKSTEQYWGNPPYEFIMCRIYVKLICGPSMLILYCCKKRQDNLQAVNSNGDFQLRPFSITLSTDCSQISASVYFWKAWKCWRFYLTCRPFSLENYIRCRNCKNCRHSIIHTKKNSYRFNNLSLWNEVLSVIL